MAIGQVSARAEGGKFDLREKYQPYVSRGGDGCDSYPSRERKRLRLAIGQVSARAEGREAHLCKDCQ